jgi:hypothetical protein
MILQKKYPNPKIIVFCTILLAFSNMLAQDSTAVEKPKPRSEFWKKVQFGGGVGLSIGSGFTNITLSPSAIYPVNQYFSLGAGVQGSYVKQRNFYNAYIYGASIIGLFNPIQNIQLSTEVEQLRVNTTFYNNLPEQNFWNTALFVGAGYVNNRVTIGIRYNILHKTENNVYSDAFIPFVRVFF